MNDQTDQAFGFEGSWREFAPIAFTNLLLTIVTLGVYRFWATTRTRRYLWSRTRFIDERLEWTGTGLELLIGFLIVMVLFGVPFLFLNFGMQAMVLQGQAPLASALGTIAFMAIFYLAGVARLRMLRYRLSRTWWHGIRGGSNDKGWAYGWSYVWRNIVGWMALGLLIPWAMTSLWNDRWNAMSFGPHRFHAAAMPGQIFRRFLLFYLLPFIIFAVFAVLFLAAGGAAMFADFDPEAPTQPHAMLVLATIAMVFLIYGIIGLVALAYYAKFFRVAVSSMSLSTLDFQFSARTKDWLKLILGDIVLVVLTLGIGLIFLSYRHWKFFIVHLDASGEISLSALTQSSTDAPGQGEGLADAFDIGAI
jgi:Predicted membrane protein